MITRKIQVKMQKIKKICIFFDKKKMVSFKNQNQYYKHREYRYNENHK